MRQEIERSAERLDNFFRATVQLMKVMARACGRDSLHTLDAGDLIAWKRELADLAGVRFAGVGRG